MNSRMKVITLFKVLVKKGMEETTDKYIILLLLHNVVCDKNVSYFIIACVLKRIYELMTLEASPLTYN